MFALSPRPVRTFPKLLPFFVIAASLFGTPSTAWGVTISFTGSLPRDLATGRFDMSIVAKEVPNAETTTVGTEKSLQDRIRIYVKGDSVNFATSAENPPAGTKFYWELRDTVTVVANADGTSSTMTWLVRVFEFDGSLATVGKDGKISLVVDYVKDGTKVVSGEGDIQRKIVVANQAPSGLIAIGSEQALTFSWNLDATIAYQGESYGAATSEAPGESVIILMRRGSNLTSLPAKGFSGSSTADSDGLTCSVDLDAGSGNPCVTCPGTSTYLDVAEIETNQSTDLKVKSTTGTSVAFAGLDNEVEYVAFAMYQPDGIKQSACLTGQPSEDLTMSELNGEKKAEPTKFHCFVATAAYGTPLHKNLPRFRWLRDEVLRKSESGTRFVNWYYRHSPPLAKFISTHPTAAALTRGVLWIPVLGVMGAESWIDRPALGAGSGILLAFALITLISGWRGRRRPRSTAQD